MKKNFMQLHTVNGNRENPFPNLSKLMALSRKDKDTPFVVFFGDSVINSISHSDTDRRGLGELLSTKIPNSCNLFSISDPGYNMKVFYSFLKAIKKTEINCKEVILPINLRSFSPQWFSNPKYQFDYELSALNVFCRTGKLEPIYFDRDKYHSIIIKRSKAYIDSFLSYEDTTLNRVASFERIKSIDPRDNKKMRVNRLKNIFIFHYLNILQPEHMLLDFLKITMKYMEKINAKLIIYITPINYLSGNSLVGAHFTKIIKSNVQTIRKSVEGIQVGIKYSFLDYSTLLGQKFFHHLNIANEHLNQEGRHLISEQIRLALS